MMQGLSVQGTGGHVRADVGLISAPDADFISVAAGVAYAVTGDVVAAITLSLLEPTVQAAVFFFHEKAWQRKAPECPATALS